MKKVMAVNAGSSSLKFKLFEMPEETVICSGIVERIGFDDAIFQLKFNGEKQVETLPVKDHGVAVKLVMDSLIKNGIIKSYDEIKATGHRIVQGGAYFSESAVINEDTIWKIRDLIPLSPLHNAAELVGIEAFQKVLPSTPGICAFDTAFHQTMKAEDYIYPIPYQYSEDFKIRRYGAHGTSHKYLSEQGLKYVNNDIHSKMIICHLGSGASITAVRDGKCVATSMGLTPLGGIMMGTRTGDIDPSVFNYVVAKTGKSAEEIYQEFNKKSGLLGVSGISSDARDIEKAANEGDKRAILACDLWARRVADFIGQYYVRLGGCDLIIFSAGIGENSPKFRALTLKKIEEALNLKIDYYLNESIHGKEALISLKESKIKVAIIPTDEEVMIARDAYNMLLKGE
ncbi:MAG: acetate kinase [Candidatus Onthovivens sp.]|nr:acetate kinase [Candidatus Onthovivens sp.]